MKQSLSEFVELNGIRSHVRTWGSNNAPVLFLLHGWMDISASFQFLVDALRKEWRVIAPDWRGFGRSQWNNHSYWFPDYVADLEALLARYSPDEPVRLVGHSMGGNVACLYAGIRPERVCGLVSLEGFGLRPSNSAEAPARYAKWLDQLRAGPAFKNHADRAAFAARLLQGNARLSAEQAAYLAEHMGQEAAGQDAGGRQVVAAGDPFHRLPNPVGYNLAEAKACWGNIAAPVLWIAARESMVWKSYFTEADFKERMACFRNIRVETLEQAGHNMHHDQPERLAVLIENFLP